MPGLLGGFASAVAAAGEDVNASRWTVATAAAEFPGRAAGRSGVVQGGYQAAVTVISLGMGIGSGLIAGRVLRNARWAEPMSDHFYEDGGEWNVPLEGEEMPELEIDLAAAAQRERMALVDAVLTLVGEAVGKDLPRPSAEQLQSLMEAGGAAAGGSIRGGPGAGARSANQRFLEGSWHGGMQNAGAIGEGSSRGVAVHAVAADVPPQST